MPSPSDRANQSRRQVRRDLRGSLFEIHIQQRMNICHNEHQDRRGREAALHLTFMVLATCVRCRLRHLSLITYSSATAATTALICSGRTYSNVADQGYKWKHYGRVVGTGRRRQRITSADLKLDSLEKPASVIVLQDIHEPKQSVSARASESNDQILEPRRILSAQDIEDDIAGHQPAPEEAEVNKSIDELQPTNTLLDQAAFDQLRQRLMKGYRLAQLSRYLRALLNPPAQHAAVGSKHLEKALKVTPWHPQRTPLDVRRRNVVRPTALGRKQRTVDRIIRLAWAVTVDTEEKEVGELELMLQPWQLSMLFDLSSSGRPYYESLIAPRLLLDATVVEHHRPDCAVRITGRRHDAEQVAYQLEVALLGVQQLQLDLASFVPESQSKDTSTPSKDSCTDEELSRVSKLTQSVILSRSRSVITIYNRTSDGVNHARRLILSLLDLSSASGTATTLTPLKSSKSGPSTSPNLVRVGTLASGIHARWQDRDLVRQVSRSPESLITLEQAKQATLDISTYLCNIESSHQPVPPHGTLGHGYWRKGALLHGSWHADLIKLLQDDSGPPTSTAGAQQSLYAETGVVSRQSVVQRNVPAVETTLSYFNPARPPKAILTKDALGVATFVNRQAPQLIAHLVPLLDDRDGCQDPPRIELRFESAATKERELSLTGMRLMLEAHTVNVPLPTETVDISFMRNRTIVAHMDSARQDPDISAFAESVRRSAQASTNTIIGPPELVIKIPAWLVSGSSQQQSSAQDVPVTYIVERFEQTHKKTFVARKDASPEPDSAVQLAMDSLGTGLRLEYKEVDGGVIYGSSTILTVKGTGPREYGKGKNFAAVDEVSKVGLDVADDSTHQVATAAVAVAGLLTKAASGTLRQ